MRAVGPRALGCAASAVGAVLIGVIDVGGMGHTTGGWCVRALFWTLLVMTTLIRTRAPVTPGMERHIGEVSELVGSATILSAVDGRGPRPWRRVVIVFTASKAIVMPRSLDRIIAEMPSDEIHLVVERHGLLHDRIRCDWPGAPSLRARLNAVQRALLARAIEVPAHVPADPLTRAVEWLRAGNRYEE
jgi:hypothetical protein